MRIETEIEMLSLYLPHVFPHLDETFIRRILEEDHHLGKVSRVDIVMKTPNKNSVYVHFDSWNDAQFAHVLRFKERIEKGDCVPLVYQGKYYWNVLKDTSKGKNFISGDRIESLDLKLDSSSSCPTMKTNQFFSDLVKYQVPTLEHKSVTILKRDEKMFKANINSVVDFNLEKEKEIEEQLYMDLFMDEIEQFDDWYFSCENGILSGLGFQ